MAVHVLEYGGVLAGVGHRAAIRTNSLAGAGNPNGTSLFRSGVVDLPDGFWDAEDFIAFADLAQPALVR